jgi:hypothetical protein
LAVFAVRGELSPYAARRRQQPATFLRLAEPSAEPDHQPHRTISFPGPSCRPSDPSVRTVHTPGWFGEMKGSGGPKYQSG